MGYVDRSDLEDALSPKTVLAIYNDGNTGRVNERAMNAVLERASAEVDSYLARVYKGSLPITQGNVPVLLKSAALDYAVAYSFERHPEYVRTFGEGKRAEHWKRAEAKMERIAQALQRIPDYEGEKAPRNVGGVLYSDAPDFSLGGTGDFLAMRFTVTVDARNLVAKLRRIKPKLEAAMEAEVRDIEALAVGYAKTHHPYRDRTYKLTESIHTEPHGLRFDLIADRPYAKYVEEGVEGRNEPYPFIRPAAEWARDKLRERLRALQIAIGK